MSKLLDKVFLTEDEAYNPVKAAVKALEKAAKEMDCYNKQYIIRVVVETVDDDTEEEDDEDE